jgi:hypothetical protein
MTRHTFLILHSAVALAVAGFALCFPAALLAGKGVTPTPALLVWVREVGVLILAAGVTTTLVRRAPDSVALRSVLIGNACLHLGLLPIELLGFWQSAITRLSGVVPNSLLHAALAVGFITYARQMRAFGPART